MPDQLTNIVVAGLGGQGVLKASDILADAALRAGFDVKKSEIKGMSQRGGSVTSDVRFGSGCFSPMVPPGEADFLLVLEPTQVEPNHYILKPHGGLITPDAVDPGKLANKKSLNVALLGCSERASCHCRKIWLDALRAAFPPNFYDANRRLSWQDVPARSRPRGLNDDEQTLRTSRPASGERAGFSAAAAVAGHAIAPAQSHGAARLRPRRRCSANAWTSAA